MLSKELLIASSLTANLHSRDILMRFALLAALFVLACPSFAELDERIKVTIEEPVQGERYSGISNLRGWAVSPEGMGKYRHEVFIDGDFAFYMSSYGKRTDV